LSVAALARRVVIPLAVDEAHTFTVTALGEPSANIFLLIVTDYATNASYDVLAGVQPYCTPGVGNLGISVSIENAGTIRGTVYLRVTDDTGAELYYDEWTLDVGGSIGVGITVDMPPRDYSITIEAGH